MKNRSPQHTQHEICFAEYIFSDIIKYIHMRKGIKMALINCPECDKEISDKTSCCPHCGYPVYLEMNHYFGKKKCPYCGTINEHYSANCKNCNGILPESEDLLNKEIEIEKAEISEEVFFHGTTNCPNCGFFMPGNYIHCENCGHDLHSAPKQERERSPVWMYLAAGFISISIFAWLLTWSLS